MNHKSIQILRTRLNNTDTKIANEVLLDGQPFYNKTSNKLYVGDGTKKISELKYIGQEAWDGFNLENGTDAVLIQTKDQNHSFKVMTDGRAKVQSAPTENDDVVRKLELDDLSNKYLPAVKATSVDYAVTTNVIFTGQTEVQNLTGVKCLSFSPTGNMGYIAKNNNIFQFPAQTGTFLLRPNDLPTETSLVAVSSTGTHAYKKVSELVDTTSEQTLTGTKTWEVVEPGITHTLGVSSGEIYSKSTYSSNGTQQRAAFFSGGIALNKSTESNPIGDYTSISFPYLVNHTDDVYKFALAPDAVPTEPSVIVNATDRHVTWKPLSEVEVSVPTRSQVDLLF